MFGCYNGEHKMLSGSNHMQVKQFVLFLKILSSSQILVHVRCCSCIISNRCFGYVVLLLNMTRTHVMDFIHVCSKAVAT